MKPLYPHITKVIQSMKAGETIHAAEMIAAMNEATGNFGSKDRRVIASEFDSTAALYLPEMYIMNFIEGEMSDREVVRIVNGRRIFFKRLSFLLPPITSLLCIAEVDDLCSTLRQIEDCCLDYTSVINGEYASKQRKKILTQLNLLIEQASALGSTLQSMEHHIEYEFEQHARACQLYFGHIHPEANLFGLMRLIETLRFASELTLYRDSIGERAFFVGDNRVRTHIVECCYRLALQFDAPKFTTTPGSDFSTLSSLLYELASGERDESLAGAINKFARSAERRLIDEEEVTFRYENSDEGIAAREADNFADVKESIQASQLEIKFWEGMLASNHWADFERRNIALRLAQAMEELESQMRLHGPFLVWASHISSEEREAMWRKTLEHERTTLEMAIARGKRIREKQH